MKDLSFEAKEKVLEIGSVRLVEVDKLVPFAGVLTAERDSQQPLKLFDRDEKLTQLFHVGTMHD